MSAGQVYGIAHVASGFLFLAIALISFFIAKRGGKRFFRVLVQETSTAEEDYRMLRGLMNLLTAGVFFLFFSIAGLLRVLSVDAWTSIFRP
jgi:hypothetical protein